MGSSGKGYSGPSRPYGPSKGYSGRSNKSGKGYSGPSRPYGPSKGDSGRSNKSAKGYSVINYGSYAKSSKAYSYPRPPSSHYDSFKDYSGYSYKSYGYGKSSKNV